ncbi:DUF7660 family protein [Pseudoalteromonas obscura]|uniref:DUF7660 domain-containing protein n=1 Tax=Pseudoalteromonas obscura TaxID=3048491 RepID=A0ABT7EG84_9GAMM|nr:hypothetical protein [Pseudoalteromonas sp. P94(2023)]MDK2594047.1 hypothetical protein [Pseudoalteromonas sp. P94(2023)]
MDVRYKIVNSKLELIELLNVIAAEDAGTWENINTRDFLEAMAAWLESADNFYTNFDLPTKSDNPSWQLFADAIQAATNYE